MADIEVSDTTPTQEPGVIQLPLFDGVVPQVAAGESNPGNQEGQEGVGASNVPREITANDFAKAVGLLYDNPIKWDLIPDGLKEVVQLGLPIGKLAPQKDMSAVQTANEGIAVGFMLGYMAGLASGDSVYRVRGDLLTKVGHLTGSAALHIRTVAQDATS
ncbi:MAG: hypothetical protein SFU83_08385 [Meiothermus sp.]|nr:hypothetical protein [Meiothermus sp.]